jgi:hypothetical protein
MFVLSRVAMLGSLLDIFQTKKSGLSDSNHNFVDAVGSLLLIAKLN